MPVITDKNKIESLLTRRVVEAVVEDSLRRKLLSGRRLRVKCGFDPSRPDLHLGHAVCLKKLREFQELGHQVIFIAGDYTAMIGDPTGNSKTRQALSADETSRNADTYLAQAGKVLDASAAEFHRNSEWLSKMSFVDVVDLAAKFTVARMIERDDFAKRLAAGADVHVHELLYPMMQARDSVAIEADVEVGATEQRFNILAGRELQKKMGLPEQDCLFVPILVGTDGVQKMSKSLGNYVGLTDSPDEMYGKTMSIPDAVLWDWFTLTTELSAEEISEIRTACERGQMNPRDAKARLAREIISQYHSSAAATAAEESFVKTFKNKETPDDVPEVTVQAGERLLIEILVEAQLAPSKTEARRLVEQGGVKVDGQTVKDVAAKISVVSQPVLIQKGKRFFAKVKGK